MKTWKQIIAIAVVSAIATAAPLAQKTKKKVPAGDPALAAKIRRFAPTVLTANTSSLSPKDRQALLKIVAAAKYYDRLFLRQIWSGNESLLQKLQADRSPLGRPATPLFHDQ
jgi:hypothetical protein